LISLNKMTYKFTFGPVPSRRLGFSLGIDIIPLKTCTYNCIYCQLFQTSNHTTTRQSFFNKDDILAEIKNKIKTSECIDYITFSGSGEPTLNSDIGLIIKEIKSFSNIPVAVITNSSLLWMPEVREDIKDSDLVLPSLDSVTEDIWMQLNRPDPSLKINKMLEGLKTFCNEHQGIIWLEIMFVSGFNDSINEARAIADYVNQLNVDLIQLNTVVRPPNESYSKPVTEEFFKEIAVYFNSKIEVIAPFKKNSRPSKRDSTPDVILDLLARRPCKPNEMAESLCINLNEISKYLQILVDQEKIIQEKSGHFSLFH